jgi:hypothetical protein
MRRWWIAFAIVLLSATAVDSGASWAIERLVLSPGARLAVALLPLPGNLALIAMVLFRIRTLDEFQKRIHFEAVVVAFLATGVAVFIHGYLQKAGFVGSLRPALLWAFMSVAYAIGYVIAIRQYR